MFSRKPSGHDTGRPGPPPQPGSQADLKRQVTCDRQVIAGLAGEVGDGVTGSCGLQSATANKVETEWQNAISSENQSADECRGADAVFKGREFDGARGFVVVE